jgi:hypothetical protein
MNASQQELNDGFLSLLGGMHSGIDPMVISPDSGVYAKGINVTARRGIIQTRPSFVPFQQLASGNFQGGFVWKLESCDRFVYVIDGVLYSMRFDTKEITTHGSYFDVTEDRLYFCQAYKWAVIQDGENTPQALEENDSGSAVVYARPFPYVDSDSPPKELALVPGTVMSYAHGRIHYVPSDLPAIAPVITDEADPDQLNQIPTILPSNGKASFVSSDILDIYVPEFVFRMTEHRVLNEGGAIELPLELGYIYGMAAMRNAATGTGTGPLVVFAREGVCAFDVSIPRTEWKSVQIGQVLFSTIGTISPHSITQINTDIGFIDTEGQLRTIRYESSSVGNSLTSTPISNELDVFIKKDDNKNLENVSMSFVDNRLTWTMFGSNRNTGDVYESHIPNIPGFLRLDGGVTTYQWSDYLDLKNWFWASGSGVSAGIGDPDDTAQPGLSRRLQYLQPSPAGHSSVFFKFKEVQRYVDVGGLRQLYYSHMFPSKPESIPVYKALASLDFAKIYSMQGPSTNPGYDGLWTGFDFQQTLTARDDYRDWRHFVVIKKNSENHLFVLDETAIKDNNDTAIQSSVWTRFMDFGSQIDTKALQYVELWASDIATDTNVQVYFRPRGYEPWTLVASKTFEIPGGQPQVRRRIPFPLTVEEIGCEPVSQEKLNIATHFQFAIVWTGRMKIDRFRAVATLRVDPPYSCLEEDNPDNVEVEAGLELDDFAYSVF